MEALQRVAFRLGEASFTLADAVLWAALVGQWRTVEEELVSSAACEGRAAAEGTPLGDGSLAAAVREFRYERDLIAADDATAWLGAWELSVEQWKAALRRRLLLRTWAPSLEGTRRRYAPSETLLATTAWADLVCRGTLERLVSELAERAAVAAGEDEPLPAGADESAPDPLLPAWIGLDARAGGPAIRRLQTLEGLYRRRRQREVTPERVRAAIAARTLDWTRFDAVRLVLATEPMAAEAALRVREDGDALADVAADVGRPHETWSGFLETAPGDLRSRLVGAAAGALLGPLREADGFALLHVLSRQPPSVDDPRVWDHAERRVWTPLAARALEAVRWESPLARVPLG